MLTGELAKKCGWKENGRYDLIVVGAGPAGIGAAIAAGRKGLKVALLESYGFAGGAGTQACTPLYYGFGVSGKQSTAGISDEFMASWSQDLEGFSAVPMGALVSPALSNALAAGRCISSEPHVISIFRMMNTCMTLGEAAGLMAALCSEGREDIRKLSYARLRPELDKAGFILGDD